MYLSCLGCFSAGLVVCLCVQTHHNWFQSECKCVDQLRLPANVDIKDVGNSISLKGHTASVNKEMKPLQFVLFDVCFTDAVTCWLDITQTLKPA